MNAEYRRFESYVFKTSQEPARPRRLAVFAALDGGHTTVSSLTRAVGGNTNVRTWISQAMRDGEIVRAVNGQLRIPDARDAVGSISMDDVPGLLTHIEKLTHDFYKLPEGVEYFTLGEINRCCIDLEHMKEGTKKWLDACAEWEQDELEQKKAKR